MELGLTTLLGPRLGPGLLGLGSRLLLLGPSLLGWPLLATLLRVERQGPNEGLLWEPERLVVVVVVVDSVDPDGLRALERPGVLGGLGLLSPWGRAFWPFGPDGVGPIANTRVGVKVEVTARLLLEAGPVRAVVKVPAVMRVREVGGCGAPAVNYRVTYSGKPWKTRESFNWRQKKSLHNGRT